MVRYRGDSPGDTTVKINRYSDGTYSVEIRVGFKYVGWYSGNRCKVSYDFDPNSGKVILGDGVEISAQEIIYGKGVREFFEAEREREELEEEARWKAKWG